MIKKLTSITSLLLIFALLLSLSSCSGGFMTDIQKLSLSFDSQMDSSNFFFGRREDEMISKERSIRIEEIESKVGYIQEFICINGNELFATRLSSPGDRKYELFKLNIDTLEYYSVCKWNEYVENPYNPNKNIHLSFSILFVDRMIYVSHGETITLINTDSLEVKDYKSSDITLPSQEYSFEGRSARKSAIDYERLIVARDDQKRELTIEYLRSKHPYVDALLKSAPTAAVSDSLDYFIYRGVIVNNEIYIILAVEDCDILHSMRGFVFSYDFDTETMEYLYSTSNALISLSIIPVI